MVENQIKIIQTTNELCLIIKESFRGRSSEGYSVDIRVFDLNLMMVTGKRLKRDDIVNIIKSCKDNICKFETEELENILSYM